MELTVELTKRIGDKLKVNWNAISPDTLKKGAEVELEHEDLFPDQGKQTVRNFVMACKIALAHLKERPDYYIKLADMERSPLVTKKSDEPIVKQEYKNVIEQMIDEVLQETRFPPKALDYNKLKDVDGFWGWSIREAAKVAGLREIGPPVKRIADIIMWLNMAAQEWERYAKSMNRESVNEVRVAKVIGGIKIVYLPDLLDDLFGKGWESKNISYDQQTEKMKHWIKKNNASYFGAPREQFFIYRAVEKAKKEGKNLVIVDDLS